MATATYNRTGRVLRFDLSDPEVALIDVIVASRGVVPFESALNDFLRDARQRRREQELLKIKEKIDGLTDAQRAQIITILGV